MRGSGLTLNFLLLSSSLLYMQRQSFHHLTFKKPLIFNSFSQSIPFSSEVLSLGSQTEGHLLEMGASALSGLSLPPAGEASGAPSLLAGVLKRSAGLTIFKQQVLVMLIGSASPIILARLFNNSICTLSFGGNTTPFAAHSLSRG